MKSVQVVDFDSPSLPKSLWDSPFDTASVVVEFVHKQSKKKKKTRRKSFRKKQWYPFVVVFLREMWLRFALEKPAFKTEGNKASAGKKFARFPSQG